MTEWMPATEAEAAMRDALRDGDQELYFRILARSELLLPVSADALAGRAPMGWGTWTTNGRTHVLAFTSTEALRACLAEHAGSARRMPYHELAANWPNLEWWLGVNPGLPIEGYLPAWFVSQLARGDVRLPGRSLGTRARMDRPEPSGRARATAAVPRRTVPARSRPQPTLATDDAPRPEAPGANWLGGGAPPTAQLPSSIKPDPAAQAAGRGLISLPSVHDPNGVDARLASVRPPAERDATAAAPGADGTGSTAPIEDGPAPDRGAGRQVTIAPTASTSMLAPRPNGMSALEDPAFAPANEVEESLLAAAGDGSTDSFLSTLLLARVLLPRPAYAPADLRPGDDGFTWHTEMIDGDRYVVVFTSRARLTEHVGASAEPTMPSDAVPMRFVHLIRAWPDESWSFAVNPGTPVGATLPGAQIVALATWAAEVGLGDDADDDFAQDEPAEKAPRVPAAVPAAARKRPTMMQKAVAPTQVGYYLDRGYDRVSGFVHRADEVAHLHTPAKLYAALGLGYPNSPFVSDAAELYVLRWPAYRPSLYRIPYGGQTEAAMRAMEGWVIERPPFRGNGFAPGDSRDVIAEFKVDSTRLPHGAQLWRMTADGSEELVALLDADGPIWRRTGES